MALEIARGIYEQNSIDASAMVGLSDRQLQGSHVNSHFGVINPGK